ncbi:MAG TPA: hypothetical protein VFW73_02340 [Lacipirellulaceae bacterium]|nr:hypothetical protein [Lacipirellulaceae bacterium]
MSAYWLFLFGVVVLLVVGWIILRPKRFTRRVRQLKVEFEQKRAELEAEFVRAASASGKPRGLAWKECAFQNHLTMARDRANGEIVGLVGVTIAFEAIEGGGMEDVEAVGNLRAATAVFTHNGREWTTPGRAMFNLEPREVVERYKESLEVVGDEDDGSMSGGACPARGEPRR